VRAPTRFSQNPTGKREGMPYVPYLRLFVANLAREDRRRRTRGEWGDVRGRKTIIRLTRWLSSENGDSSLGVSNCGPFSTFSLPLPSWYRC